MTKLNVHNLENRAGRGKSYAEPSHIATRSCMSDMRTPLHDWWSLTHWVSLQMALRRAAANRSKAVPLCVGILEASIEDADRSAGTVALDLTIIRGGSMR